MTNAEGTNKVSRQRCVLTSSPIRDERHACMHHAMCGMDGVRDNGEKTPLLELNSTIL